MSPTPAAHVLEGFSTIGPGIYFQDNSDHEQGQDSDTTSPKYLRKYTHAYAKLYPNASQIVVRCSVSTLWSTISTIWSFASALILDSCPTPVQLKTVKHAFSVIVQNPVVRYGAFTFVSAVYYIRLCLSLLFGKRMKLVSDSHIDIGNPRVLPWMGVHTPRLYLFSRKDRSSPWEEVMHHAKTAKECGMDVRCELFEESEHVAHMRVEPERYWSSVQEVWVVAISKEEDEQRILQITPA
ncbi:hypothetical protein BDR04DRAFT_1115006 [Suillus decipiens]|nr:hypothetical protein BDR04DRAFT_1115006 [Suillus decipiens]